MKKIITLILTLLSIYSIQQMGKAFSSNLSEVEEQIIEEQITENQLETLKPEIIQTNLADEEVVEEESNVSGMILSDSSTTIVSDHSSDGVESSNSNENTIIEQNQPENNSNNINEEPIQESNIGVENNTNSNQSNKISTSFYDSITGGIIEFNTDIECLSKGEEIENQEINDILNWNELNPDNLKQQDINYYRCYPVIKENQQGWFLNIFCKSGDCNSKYK